MARRKGSKGGELVLVVVGAIVAAIASVPKEVWIAIVVIAAIGGMIWLLANVTKSSTSESTETSSPQLNRTNRGDHESTRFEVHASSSYQSRKPKGKHVPTRWIAKDETVEVAGTQIRGGLIYVGSDLTSWTGETDPALIDPRHEVTTGDLDLSIRRTEYWPSYSTISPDARRAYLNWLAGGRCNPRADVGYVFLFFYGLERRALIDAESDPAAKADLPEIEQEVGRLLDIYRESRSFARYATEFLNLLVMRRTEGNVHEGEPPSVDSRGIPTRMCVALGRMAMLGMPVPPQWAFAWVQCDPRISLPIAVRRCDKQFEKLFLTRYRDQFGDGMSLSVNRTKLKIGYRPASSGFGRQEFPVVSGEIPDINAVIAPLKKLEGIVEYCAEALAPFSRFISKNQEEANSLEGLLLLPRTLWPDSASEVMEALSKKIGDGLRVMSLGELLSNFGSSDGLTRDRFRSLAHALAELHIGIEPDVLAGARTPKVGDRIILFRTETEDGSLRASAAYQVASVTLDIGCSVAMADGKVHPNELRLLMKQIDGWVQLSGAQRKRLRARLRMSIDEPPSVPSMKKRLEAVPMETKRAIAHLLSALAQSDGLVNPDEVKLLEKVYKLLGIEAQAAYSDLHKAAMNVPSAAESKSSPAGAVSTGDGFVLNSDRIAALKRETDAVSALLASVFIEESVAPIEEEEERKEAEATEACEVHGLDVEHSNFLRLILTRPSWARKDLSDAAGDMDLMLDGVLERINEMAIDHFDEPLIEGEDPIEVSREVGERIVA